MARCLVTGHKGYIGSKLYQALLDDGHDVIGIDLKSEIPHDILVDLKEGSDGKFHPYWYNFKPEYIFHLACWPRVAFSIEKPVATAINNILSNSIMLNFARKVGSVKRFIYSSSSSVVGNGSGPESPYALQKYTAEMSNSLNQFNQTQAEYQGELQRVIQEAQLISGDDAQKLQKYASEVQTYSADTQSKLGDYSAKVQKLNTKYQWAQGRYIALRQEYNDAFGLLTPPQQKRG